MQYPFTIYNKATGEILRSGAVGHEGDVPLQVMADGEGVLELLADVHSHRVDLATLTLVPCDKLRRVRLKREATHRRIKAVAELGIEALRTDIRLREDAGVPVLPEKREELKRLAQLALAHHTIEREAHARIDKP